MKSTQLSLDPLGGTFSESPLFAGLSAHERDPEPDPRDGGPPEGYACPECGQRWEVHEPEACELDRFARLTAAGHRITGQKCEPCGHALWYFQPTGQHYCPECDDEPQAGDA